MKKRYLIIAGIALLILYLSIFGFGSTITKDYTVSIQPDGGYLLNITVYKRYWKLITAEGVFPKERKSFLIKIAGKGRDWSARNQQGYYLAAEDISSNVKGWDFGYGWVDSAREYLYLNLYWVKSPNCMVASDVIGKFRLVGQ